MTTVSVPLSASLLQSLEKLVASGAAANKADAVRKALQAYIEQQEVTEILRASQEPRLEGEIDALAGRLS